MKNKQSVVCFGEVLIDMISMNIGSLVDSKGFLKKFGGAPANTAVGLAKLGIPVSFIGKVGNDPFGHYLIKTLDKYGVKTNQMVISQDLKTTLAFVSITPDHDRDFYFFKGAHDSIEEKEVKLPLNTSIFHFGSLTQTNASCRKATDKLINEAKNLKATISYDPNLRISLWDDVNDAKKIMLNTLPKVHIFKVSEQEAVFLTGEKDIKAAAKKLYKDNLQALFITLGEKGCFFMTKTATGTIPCVPVDVVDTTGAGDAFNAGYIYELTQLGKPISSASKEEITDMLTRANMIAGLSTRKKGAISAFPSKSELRRYLNSK